MTATFTKGDLALSLVKAGHSHADAARAAGCSRELVRQRASEAGLPTGKTKAGKTAISETTRRRSRDRRLVLGFPEPETLVGEFDAGVTYNELAIRYGMTWNQVYGSIRRYKKRKQP